MIGTVMTMAPGRSIRWVPRIMNCGEVCDATGAVMACGVAVSDSASSRSFQAKMNTRIAAVTTGWPAGDHPAERLRRGGAVHLGGLPAPTGSPGRTPTWCRWPAAREGDVRDDQPGQVSNRPIWRHTLKSGVTSGEIAGTSRSAAPFPPAASCGELQPGHRVGGHPADDDGDHRGDQPDADRTEQCRIEPRRR